MTPDERKQARASLAGLWGSHWHFLRAALDQLDDDEKRRKDDEGLMLLAEIALRGRHGRMRAIHDALRARLGPAPEPEADHES